LIRALTLDQVPPSRTLPALYVLDSIVKNVPTPYALYFGPKLYSIFMGAYTKVDNATRRKMDEMLKTWKEPVPGSISTKPVFPLEQVRPIENALMAARNAAFAAHQSSYQGQQQLMRGRQPAPPSRETPTPPTARSYQPPPQQPPYPGSNGHRPDTAPQQPYPMHPVIVSSLPTHLVRLFCC
jgi:pre-mRNA cleavage complex 2 protein Pcf11